MKMTICSATKPQMFAMNALGQLQKYKNSSYSPKSTFAVKFSSCSWFSSTLSCSLLLHAEQNLFKYSHSHSSEIFVFITEMNLGNSLITATWKSANFYFIYSSVEPSSPTGKTYNWFHYLQVKTNQSCYARSRKPFTERPERQPPSTAMAHRDKFSGSLVVKSFLSLFSFRGLPPPQTQLKNARLRAFEVANGSKNAYKSNM